MRKEDWRHPSFRGNQMATWNTFALTFSQTLNLKVNPFLISPGLPVEKPLNAQKGGLACNNEVHVFPKFDPEQLPAVQKRNQPVNQKDGWSLTLIGIGVSNENGLEVLMTSNTWLRPGWNVSQAILTVAGIHFDLIWLNILKTNQSLKNAKRGFNVIGLL